MFVIGFYIPKQNELTNIKIKNRQKSNEIESKSIFHLDPDSASAAAPAAFFASAAASVETTVKTVVKTGAAAAPAAASVSE